jgi:hypothetical protein
MKKKILMRLRPHPSSRDVNLSDRGVPKARRDTLKKRRHRHAGAFEARDSARHGSDEQMFGAN